jgi:hypothetical protein
MGGRPGYLTLPIFSVVAAIGYVYYTTVFVAMPRWLGLSTAAGVANAAAFTALAAACLATYAVAVRRDPGRVPPGFVPDVEDAESTVHEIKRKVRSRWRCPTPPLSLAPLLAWVRRAGLRSLLGVGVLFWICGWEGGLLLQNFLPFVSNLGNLTQRWENAILMQLG